jgi:alpha-N-arabinofuranosidase
MKRLFPMFTLMIVLELFIFLCCYRIGLTQTVEPSLPLAVKIDASQHGAEISPFIYGQFIEHLGRCINGGGIWAEMLEDRKFFYPVGDKESAWKAIYDCNLRMTEQQPFVGKHSPESFTIENEEPRWLGVWQNGLAVRKGKKYNGYAWVKPSEGIQRIEVHFHWSDKKEDHDAFKMPVNIGDFYKIEFVYEPINDFDNVMLEIAAFGEGTFTVGCVSLMPSDNINGLRADTLELLKRLDSPIYRWPGGNFVSGYEWKDGIGDRDKRPPRKNPAWKGVEPNDFGVNEFLQFCKILKTEPYIAVNTGNGEVENAIQELEYVNGDSQTPMGQLRAKHGFPEPYNVTWWGIGNEMYGNWQIGHIPVEKYVEKHNTFVDAFRAKAPKIKVIGVGNVGKWDEAFLPGTAKHLDLISEHFYVGVTKDNVMEHVKQIPNEVKRIADAHRNYRKTLQHFKDVTVPIALDEWNYWHNTPQIFGELGIRYNIKDGLGIAAGLHEFARQSDVYFMANYAQTVNVIGCIKTSKTAAKMETTGLVLELYRKRFGNLPVKTETDFPNGNPIDIQAALSGNRLTVGIINTLGRDVTIKMDIQNFDVSGKILTLYEITDPQNDPNGFNDPDQPSRIEIKETKSTTFNSHVLVKPYSVTLLEFD